MLSSRGPAAAPWAGRARRSGTGATRAAGLQQRLMISVLRPRTRTASAILLVACGVTLFGIMDGLAKLLAGRYPVIQVVWARYAFAVPVILASARPAAWPGLLRCERPSLQAGRGLLPVLANVTVIVGLGLMPLADATAISFASPLLVVALSAPLLGERVSAESWVGVACGFAGVLLIVRPGAGTIAWAALFPLGTAFFFALYQVLTRLVSRSDAPVVTLAWTVLVGLALTTPLLPSGWHPVRPSDWPLLVLSGLLFGVAQLLLIQAFARAPAAVLAPFTYAQIIAAVVFGVLVFGDVPDLWTSLGTGLVILAGVHVLRRRRHEAGQKGTRSAGGQFPFARDRPSTRGCRRRADMRSALGCGTVAEQPGLAGPVAERRHGLGSRYRAGAHVSLDRELGELGA